MANHLLLDQARAGRNDEFYTQLSDIENEMQYYTDYFKGKIVLCNCDDPFESNFFKYFALNFNTLGLKKLITTCYATSPIMCTELTFFGENNSQPFYEKGERQPYYIEISEVQDLNKDEAIDLDDIKRMLQICKYKPKKLSGNGDFMSDECVKLLKEADVVVTNPPFSLFRQYIAQLISFNKRFIILGNQNALSYKETFRLIRDNKLWLGASIHSGDVKFNVPESYPLNAATCGRDENDRPFIKVKGIRWFTNIDYPKRHEPMILFKKHSPDLYPKYDNYDAINIDKSSDIPCDYYGVMGVPLTFIDKYSPDQFEIIGMISSAGYDSEIVGIPFLGEKDARPIINNKVKYARILIKRRCEK